MKHGELRSERALGGIVLHGLFILVVAAAPFPVAAQRAQRVPDAGTAAGPSAVSPPRPYPVGGKYGFVGPGGVFVIQPQYEYADEFSEGVAVVGHWSGELVADPTGGPRCRIAGVRWSYIDLGGKSLFSVGLSGKRPGPMSEGRALVWQDGKAGYVDARGTLVVRPRFDDGKPFAEGLAPVQVGRLWGYIGPTGRVVIPPQYESAEPFENGIGVVVSKDGSQAIDSNGHPAFEGYAAVGMVSKGLTPVCKGPRETAKCGYFDTGKRRAIVIPFQFEDALPFSEDLAGVKRGGKWGFVDASGTFTIAPRFESLEPIFLSSGFHEGLAPVQDRGKWGFIDKGGRFAVRPSFLEVRPFAEGLAAVRVGELWGYVDHSGKAVVRPTFRDAYDFHEGLARVAIRPSPDDDRRYGFIDRGGHVVLPFVFADAYDFADGYAAVNDATFGRARLVDRRGRTTAIRQYPELAAKGCDRGPASLPYEYRLTVRFDTEPQGAQVYLVPLWDWETNGDGRALLADPDKLDIYRVTEGLTSVTTIARRQVYVVVFDIDRRRVIRKLTPTDGDNQFRVQLK